MGRNWEEPLVIVVEFNVGAKQLSSAGGYFSRCFSRLLSIDQLQRLFWSLVELVAINWPTREAVLEAICVGCYQLTTSRGHSRRYLRWSLSTGHLQRSFYKLFPLFPIN